MVERLRVRGCQFAWLLLLFVLPITSMPLVQTLLGSSTVAAPAILPLLLLVAVWLLPYLAQRGKLPSESLPLLGFALIGIVSSVVSLVSELPAYKDIPAWQRFAEALITLGIGVSFYLVAATWVKDETRLRASLRWINFGGALVLLWSLAQAAAWFTAHRYPDWMRDFNDLISLGPLYRARVSGFALEPSWLAHQLNMLYLPLWLAFSLRRTSAHGLRLAGMTLENLLLIAGIGVLGLSFSRVGLVAFAAVGLLLFVMFNRRLFLWLRRRLPARVNSTRTLQWVLAFGFIFGYSLILMGGLYLFSRLDPRMADIFNLSSWRSGGFVDYANQLQFGERAVYWQAGWNIFARHPWLGVGLGNAGYYFDQALPAYAWNLIEVQRLMFHSVELLNIKSLWVRLLAETGLTGFSVFVTWLTVLGWVALGVYRRGHELAKPLGLAVVFILVALIFEGFSVDSFALPYYWVAFGLLSASARIVAVTAKVKEGFENGKS